MSIALESRSHLAPEADVVARARALVPLLRSRHEETDRLSRVPADIGAELEAAGLFSMMLPREYGGLETSISTWLEAVRELGRGDGGVAWAVTLVNACTWMASGLYPRHITDQLFAKPTTHAAGVFSGRGANVRRAAGGIVVEKGMWFFNSGVYHAEWDLLGIPMVNEKGENIGPGIALVPMSDVTILNDWDTIGLRGSGSSNVTMENVFIPDERIVGLMACTNGEQAGAFHDRALYRTAFAPLMVAILSFPVLGMGAHMLEEFMATLPKRDIKLTPYTKAGEAAATHLQVGEASAKIAAALALMQKAAREMDTWAASGDYMPLEQRASICRDTAFADQLVWEGADILASAGGGSFARRGNTLNRIWGDIKVASMHPFVSRSSNYEMYGRLLSGVEPLLMPV
jgi:3-hydroxy-9,10-secoandrosta-1,3,5(10)-triene-9,17-dione monooxygenase